MGANVRALGMWCGSLALPRLSVPREGGRLDTEGYASEARWRAEQLELERSYLFVSRPLLGMPYRYLRCVSVFAFVSHVSVATVVPLYEG